MQPENKRPPFLCPVCNNHCSVCTARGRDCYEGCARCREEFRFTPHPAAPSREKNTAVTSAGLISQACDEIKLMLLEKNAKYGDSALNPARIFSKADPVEQIRVRIDDKLSRIRTSGEQLSDEDTARDLVGYLVLLLVAKKMQRAQDPSGGRG